MRKAYIMLGALLLPVATMAEGNDTVNVSSLQVKERIRSIEQINVSAATEQADIAPASKRVADLLLELDQIDEDGQPAPVVESSQPD